MFLVQVTEAMLINNNHNMLIEQATVATIINNNHNMFIAQATFHQKIILQIMTIIFGLEYLITTRRATL